MVLLINTVAISGNLTKDPEIRGNQGKIVAFSIAYNERYRDATGKYRDNVSYFDIVKFGPESYCNYLMQNLKKGMKVTITGKLNQNRWESGGKTFYSVQIVADAIDFFHVQNKRGQQQQNQGGQPQDHGEYDPYDYYNSRDNAPDFGSMYSENNKVEMDPY